MSNILLSRKLKEKIAALEVEVDGKKGYETKSLKKLKESLDHEIYQALVAYFYLAIYYPLTDFDNGFLRCVTILYPSLTDSQTTNQHINLFDNSLIQAKVAIFNRLLAKKNYFMLEPNQMLVYGLLVAILEFNDIVDDVEQDYLRMQNQERYLYNLLESEIPFEDSCFDEDKVYNMLKQDFG